VTFRAALSSALRAARENVLPGLLLQGTMLLFFFAYVAHEGTRHFLAEIGSLKQHTGYAFAWVSYVVAGALLPEVLRIACFQRGVPCKKNLSQFLLAVPLWGLMGIAVDLLYQMQSFWFGSGGSLWSVVPKVLVDQFIVSPFVFSPIIVGYFFLSEERFRAERWRALFSWTFVWDRVFPTQVAGWFVWLPALFLIYAMPPLLQLPVAVLVQVFWVLLFTTLNARRSSCLVAKI